MASLPWVESDVVRDVTVALLSLPEKRLGFRWVVESDFRSTWQLLKDLRIGGPLVTIGLLDYVSAVLRQGQTTGQKGA